MTETLDGSGPERSQSPSLDKLAEMRRFCKLGSVVLPSLLRALLVLPDDRRDRLPRRFGMIGVDVLTIGEMGEIGDDAIGDAGRGSDGDAGKLRDARAAKRGEGEAEE